jgi:hypothetical protein
MPVAFMSLAQVSTHWVRDTALPLEASSGAAVPLRRRRRLHMRPSPCCSRSRLLSQAKNPPPWPLYAKYGAIADAQLNAALPTALAMCATAQTMVGLTLIFSLFTRQREVVRLRLLLAAQQGHCALGARSLARSLPCFCTWLSPGLLVCVRVHRRRRSCISTSYCEASTTARTTSCFA